MRPDEQWLERFAKVTRAATLEYYRRDSCITSARIGAAVLRHFGVLVRLVPVRLLAVTADLYEKYQQGHDLNDPALKGIGHSVLIQGTGRVSVSPDGRRLWNGHVVLVLKHPATLVDLSIDQASRPEKGLVLDEPVVMPVPDAQAFRAGEPLAARNHDGTFLLYRVIEDDGWKAQPKEPDVKPLIITNVIEELTEQR